MASQDLRRLWKLSNIDNGLVEIRNRAAKLDTGAKIQADIQRLEDSIKADESNARKLRGEQKDLELKQKSIQDKLAAIEKELYSGRVVNAREVENFEKEKVSLKRLRDSADERLLELFELLPPAEELEKKILARIESLKKSLVDRRKKAIEEKKQLEAEFARLNAARPDAVRIVAPGLLARYESIRQRYGGIGMVEVVDNVCGGCGTNQPERTLEALKEDKVVTCESCHRLFYYTEGVI